MRIIVLVSGLRYDSQRHIVDGILEKAKEDNTDVYVFTCDAWTYSTAEYSVGETNVLFLPDFSSYDGVILHGDTVYDKDVINKVCRKIREAKTPCVTLNDKHQGMYCVGMQNASGTYEIVDHMIKVHHAKRIAFIAGPKGNSDSKERFKSTLKAIADNQMEFDDTYFYYGDYHSESGDRAIEYFSQLPGEFPDAIIAANDEMALGAFYALKERGISVPEQVKLAGYDYSFAGRHNYPEITTVERPEIELGALAYQRLKDVIAGKQVKASETLKSRPIFTESCGCPSQRVSDEKKFRASIIKDKLHVTTYSQIIKSSSVDFTRATSYEQLLIEIKRYIKIMALEEFYMCMCVVDEPSPEDIALSTPYTEALPHLAKYARLSYIPIAYRNGQYENYGRFETEKLLPDKYISQGAGNFYTVLPLHHQSRCWGYCILVNSRLMMDSEIFHLFIMNINNALENLRKQDMLNSIVKKLDRMWVYDTLTGVFNRAGFFKFAPNIIKEAIEKEQNLFVLFLDLDDLKGVNDAYGHDEGDNYIKAMGDVMSRVKKHGELLMRYGGDEFVVLAQGYTQEDGEIFIERVKAGMEQYNAFSGKEYTLDASMGFSIVEPEMGMNLEDLIESADREMYKAKKEKKKRKKMLENK